MKIGVNASRLAGQRLGVARYIEHLARHWGSMLSPSEEATLFLRKPLEQNDLPERLEKRVLPSRLEGILWENVVLSRAARAQDVLFCPGYTVPATYRGRSVVAIHSLNEAQKGAHPWWYDFTYSQIYRSSAKRAERVIVPSRSTLEDIQEHYRLPAEKLVVVPLGADEAFRPIADEQLLRDVRRKYLGTDAPYIVFVGKFSQRRNIPTLIRAFAAAKQEASLPHRLLLFGPNHLDLPLESIAAEAGVAGSVIQDDGAISSHGELALVYNAADLFVSASSYEGFSLPLVEALACGCPTAVVKTSALAEIGGDASLLVDEPSVDALAEAIARALTDEDLRATLVSRGLERARRFRWEDAARQTLAVLREAAGR
jgi:glycosyltransferase involved in cell wall biosynthesis